jgi:hypothetical protein
VRRRFFIFLSLVSLLVSATAASIWVRSFWVTDSIWRKVDGGWDIPFQRADALASARGAVVLAHEQVAVENLDPAYLSMLQVEWKRERKPPEPTYPNFTLSQISPMDGKPRRQFSFHLLGLIVAYRDEFPDVQRMRENVMLIVIPDAAIAALAGLPALICIYGWQKRRRQSKVQLPCSACGYSLVGNASGICPECGGAVADLSGSPSRL